MTPTVAPATGRSLVRGRGGTCGFLAAAALSSLLLVVLLQLRYGYLSGTDDHQVLSLQGLQWARPGFLVGDWFVRSAPQPHVLFDVVTWLGARAGHLSTAYLLWWLLGLVVGGSALAVLARTWAPRRPVLAAVAVAAVLALGPEVALGSTTPALPIALPHGLGGFLAFATGVLLLTRRPRGAAIACVATAVVHVQIGALIAVVCVLAVAAVRLTERRWWWWPLGGAGVSAAVVVTVLRLRPVAAEPDDFVQICHEVIPFHCDVPTWSAGRLYSGFAVVAAAVLSVAWVRRDSRPDVALWAAVVLAPAAGLTLGVLAGGLGVPVLGRLAQSTNIFRLAVLVLPFGAWGLVAGVQVPGLAPSRPAAASRSAVASRWLRTAVASRWLRTAVAAVCAVGWLEPRDGTTVLAGHLAWTLAVVVPFAAAGLVEVVRRPLPAAAPAVLAATAALALVTGSVAVGAVQWRPVRTAFVADPVMRRMGALVARHVPPGEVVEAPPWFGVLRLASGRSLVVDCKAVPYGGAAWRDYRARLEALGGRAACSNGGQAYTRLPAGELVAVADRYGARYLVLTARDARGTQLVAAGWRVLAAPSRRWGSVWLLAAPDATDARAGS